ncbi:hypothetical protein [Actinomadura flavalba]|uniref:hypothetical protein n=1 Tax=Actinomadura flavalba TaxID=1120938 RepID=UPI0003663C47|nr:hypothetical protein [Actinomadura flavalba]
MTTTTGTESRAAAIAGLRALADFLDANPAVPFTSRDLMQFTAHDTTDDTGRATVDHIAALLDVPVCDETADGGHYTTTRHFGPLAYRLIHIPTATRTRHLLTRSYETNITFDPPEQTEAA